MDTEQGRGYSLRCTSRISGWEGSEYQKFFHSLLVVLAGDGEARSWIEEGSSVRNNVFMM